MARSNDKRMSKRVAQLGVLGLTGLLVVGFLAFWFFFRDTSPASVNSDEAAAARDAAIADALQDPAVDTAAIADVLQDPAVDTAATTDVLQDPAVDTAETSDVLQDPAVDTAETTDATQESAIDTTDTTDSADNGSEAEPDPGPSPTVAEVTNDVWTVDTSIGSFDDSCLSNVCSSTFVGFRIDEELASIGAKTVVGRTGDVSGSIELVGTHVTKANFVVDMTTLVTDDERRTTAITGASGGLETKTFPEASFVLVEPIELGEIPDEGVTVEVQAVGALSVHGVTRQVTISLTVEQQAGVVIVFGNLENMLLADYDIPGPTAFGVVSVEDNATMELQLFLRQ